MTHPRRAAGMHPALLMLLCFLAALIGGTLGNIAARIWT